MIPGQPNNVSNILTTFRPQERWVKKAHNHGVFSTYPTFPTFLPQDNTPICFQIRTGLPTEERERRDRRLPGQERWERWVGRAKPLFMGFFDPTFCFGERWMTLG